MVLHLPHCSARGYCAVKAQTWKIRFDLVLAVAVLTTWVAIIPRIVPNHDADRGTFVSVAARLLYGDTLYSGVWDNKEPLFYYFVAGQLTLGPWGEVAAEVLALAITVAAAYFIAVKLASRWTAIAISFIAVPITVTGKFYIPGDTELPGVALVLVSIAAAAYERRVLAGLCIGLLVFTKLIFAPIALVGVGSFLLAHRRFFDVLSVMLGVSTSAVFVVGVLVVRGELLPFTEIIRQNIAYSQGMAIATKGLPSLVEHMRRVGAFGEIIPLLLAIMLTFIALSGKQKPCRTQLAIAVTCVSTFASSLVVLSITGIWEYHSQILYIPAIICILSLGPLLDTAAKRARTITVGVVILMGYLMGGSLAVRDYIKSVQSFRASYAALGELSPEARRLLAIGSSGTYARFGQNDDLGHAIGLRHWKLACPRFAQYFFQPAALLNEAFECASKSPTLIISASLQPGPDWPAFSEFVARVERLIKSYSCDASSGLRICTRPLQN
jgi:hypothetical protein